MLWFGSLVDVSFASLLSHFVSLCISRVYLCSLIVHIKKQTLMVR